MNYLSVMFGFVMALSRSDLCVKYPEIQELCCMIRCYTNKVEINLIVSAREDVTV